jgi:DnaA family protein
VTHQLLLGVRLRDNSVFASYFAGTNAAAVDALRALAPGTLPPCVFLHGPPGTGKSHLLQAVCADAARRGLTAAYLPLQELSRMGPSMLSGWGELDIVCIDDIECVAAQSDWNRALFALHQQLEERRSKLLVASVHAPAALPMTLRDLASRLAGGLILTLHALSEAEQLQALQLHAQLRGFELPEETASYMLRRLPRDMTTLCRVLDELDEASLVAQRRLTVRFVTEVLNNRS